MSGRMSSYSESHGGYRHGSGPRRRSSSSEGRQDVFNMPSVSEADPRHGDRMSLDSEGGAHRDQAMVSDFETPMGAGARELPPDARRKCMLRATEEAKAAAIRDASFRTPSPARRLNLEFDPGWRNQSPRREQSPTSPWSPRGQQGGAFSPQGNYLVREGRAGYQMVGGYDRQPLLAGSAAPARSTTGLVRAAAVPLLVLCPLLLVVVVLAALVIFSPGADVPWASGRPVAQPPSLPGTGGWLGLDPFNCDAADSGSPMGDVQRDWCCRVRGVGCSTASPESPTLVEELVGSEVHAVPEAPALEEEEDKYDCREGFQHWRSGWSDRKKDWCCYQYSRGCEEGPA